MSARTSRILAAQFGIFALIALLLSSVQSVVFDHSFYIDLYQRIHLSQTTGVSDPDLRKAIFLMTDYVEGKTDSLQDTIVRDGQSVPVFNEKEIRHMKDVRTLYRRAMGVMVFSWAAALIAAVLVLKKKKLAGLSDLFSGFAAALASLIVLLIILACWGMDDFNGFWFWFHTIVFPGNSDWLLNPATDFMIVICPEQMFSSMILVIALRLLAACLVPAAVGWILLKNQARLPQTPQLEKEVS